MWTKEIKIEIYVWSYTNFNFATFFPGLFKVKIKIYQESYFIT